MAASVPSAHLVFFCPLVVVVAEAAAGALAVPAFAAELDRPRHWNHHGASPAHDAPTSTPALCRPGVSVPAPSSPPGAMIPSAALEPDATAPAPSPAADSKSNAAAALLSFTWPAVLAGAASVAATLII